VCTVDFNELGLDLTWHTKRAGTCGTAAGVGLRHGKNSTLPWRRTKSRITYYINMSSISIEKPRSSSRGGRSSNSSSSYRCLWWCPIYRGWLSCLIVLYHIRQPKTFSTNHPSYSVYSEYKLYLMKQVFWFDKRKTWTDVDTTSYIPNIRGDEQYPLANFAGHEKRPVTVQYE